jgi:hypothetical protein
MIAFQKRKRFKQSNGIRGHAVSKGKSRLCIVIVEYKVTIK